MFDKYKARKQRIEESVAKFEETHDNFRAAHAHFAKHRTKYIVVASVVTASGVTFVVTRKFAMPILPDTPSVSAPVTAVQQASNSIGDVSDTATVSVDQSVTVIQHINGAGRLCKILEDLDHPGDLTKTVKAVAEELAEEFDVPFETARVVLSKHINGHSPHAFGRHFGVAGVATV